MLAYIKGFWPQVLSRLHHGYNNHWDSGEQVPQLLSGLETNKALVPQLWRVSCYKVLLSSNLNVTGALKAQLQYKVHFSLELCSP